VKHSATTQSISWFRDEYTGDHLNLRPDFQRKPVWGAKQRCALIESVLLEIPIPEVYVQVTEQDESRTRYWVVDGQQRLRTILQFMGVEKPEHREPVDEDNNNFVLDALPADSKYYNISFGGLSQSLRLAFLGYRLCVRELFCEELKEIEDVFKRLNKNPMPLRPQELRNATYHGPFAKLSQQLADDEYWAVNRIMTPAGIRRMADIEMMSELLVGLMHGPQGGAPKVLDEYYRIYENEDEIPEQKRIVRLFARTKEMISRLFPKIGDTYWSNRADYYSLFVGLGEVLQSHTELSSTVERRVRDALLKFREDVARSIKDPESAVATVAARYARAIEKGVNDRGRRKARHDALTRVLTDAVTSKR